MLRETVFVAEDAHRAEPKLVACSHDPHSDFAAIRGHQALERHLELRRISRRAQESRSIEARPSSYGEPSHEPMSVR